MALTEGIADLVEHCVEFVAGVVTVVNTQGIEGIAQNTRIAEQLRPGGRGHPVFSQQCLKVVLGRLARAQAEVAKVKTE